MRTEALLLIAGLSACAGNGGPMGDDDDGGGSADCGMKTSGVSTLAGAAASGYVDGPGCTARFHNPVNTAVGPDGTVYVASRRPLKVGEIVTVKIERSDDYDLHGTAAGF